MPETTPLIKAALNLRGGAGFDVYKTTFFTSLYKKSAKYLPRLYGDILTLFNLDNVCFFLPHRNLRNTQKSITITQ